MRRTIASTIAGVCALGAVAPAVMATAEAAGVVAGSSAASTSSITRWTKGTTNVRASASTAGALVGSLPQATRVTGALDSRTGWVRIATPSQFAGRYVSATTLTSSAPREWTLYVAYAGKSSYGAPSTSASRAPLTVGQSVKAVLVGGVWARVVSGSLAGRYVDAEDFSTTDPASPAKGSSAPSSHAKPGVTVTRWVAATSASPSPVVVRQAPTTHSTKLAELGGGSAVTGQYIDARWFRITSGPQAGRYVSAGRLVVTKDLRSVNGAMPASDLCALPREMTTIWEPTTPRYLDCGALAGLTEMNAAFKARFGYGLTVDEGFRDRTKQDFFFALWGANRAATPGESNHGFAAAVDLDGSDASPYTFGSAADTWLTQHGLEYGWDRPSFLDEGYPTSEFWHYNWVG